ncbi:uncharacterized protein [Watersipora subatra]|uniref:uncharacterized protein n=1 Tax=Watersipora subatra TaxID=2589382 RepID=UPI00355C3C43
MATENRYRKRLAASSASIGTQNKQSKKEKRTLKAVLERFQVLGRNLPCLAIVRLGGQIMMSGSEEFLTQSDMLMQVLSKPASAYQVHLSKPASAVSTCGDDGAGRAEQHPHIYSNHEVDVLSLDTKRHLVSQAVNPNGKYVHNAETLAMVLKAYSTYRKEKLETPKVVLDEPIEVIADTDQKDLMVSRKLLHS